MKTKATALVLGLVLIALGGCDRYTENDLELITGFRAKSLCSCLFVMQQSEQHCIDWTVQSPNVATFAIDYEKQVVETQAVMMWGGRAHFVSEHHGCLLE